VGIEAEIFARAQAVAGLTALVGTRFYPTTAPQGATVPYCVFTLLSSSPHHTMGSDSSLTEASYEVTCYAADADAATALAVQVKAAFSRYSGTPVALVIQSVLLEDEDAGFDIDTTRHYRDLNFVFWFLES